VRLGVVPENAAYQPRSHDMTVPPTVYRVGAARLAPYSSYAQFGSAVEVALADMRVERMFPADAEAGAALLALAG
jgi:hypothetical protein